MTEAETGKCVVASIGPEWCYKILSGQKLYEVRRNRPKIPTPFRCLVYCTKNKQRMTVGRIGLCLDDLYRLLSGEIRYGCSVELAGTGGYTADNFLNGKVIAEFVCDEIKEYAYTQNHDGEWLYGIPTAIGEQTGMEYEQAAAYGGRKTLYLWHITDLKEYEKPLRLGAIGLKNAPQSWQYVILEE